MGPLLADPSERLATRFCAAVSIVLSLLSSAACGGEGDAADGGSDAADESNATAPNGVVVPPWGDYCVATFSTEYDVVDSSGDAAFTARAGDAYLMQEYDESAGGPTARLIYLAEGGPWDFQVATTPGGALPFSSNCAPGAVEPYYAVFADVEVYAEEQLETKLCSIAAGTAVPRANGSTGYSTADFGLGSGPVTYEILLNGFSSACSNQPRGYVSVPATKLFGTTTHLVPFYPIIKPKK